MDLQTLKISTNDLLLSNTFFEVFTLAWSQSGTLPPANRLVIILAEWSSVEVLINGAYVLVVIAVCR